ncbi:MAG TPA: GNAT family N-acetyltransferase [Trebonia sp.]
MESAATDAPVVTDNPAANRYELHVGDELAGLVNYRLDDHDKVIDLVHTEVKPAFQHAHLGTRLARFSLDDARKRGLAVLPYCPYITSWIKKHPEYIDLVPQDRRADFRL